MKILIAGGGSVGRHMAAQLAAAGDQPLIVDNDFAMVGRRREAAGSSGVRWMVGDACDVSVLEQAGARTADVFTAVTGDDEDNLVASLLAKQEFGIPRVIARVNNPGNEWLFNEMWGVDIAVSTPHLLTSLVQEAVSVGALVRLLSLQRGRANLVEVTLSPQSPACGRTIAASCLPREAAVVAMIRSGHVIVPTVDTVLNVHDEIVVLLTGTADDETALHRALIG
jgi:trk system potassium uptake protein